MLQLPEELRDLCAAFLDTPSAGIFAQVSRACGQAVRVRLASEKIEYETALAQAAAEAAARAPRPRRIAFTAAGAAFIDAHLDDFATATPSQRQEIAQHILTEVATRNVELGRRAWHRRDSAAWRRARSRGWARSTRPTRAPRRRQAGAA